MSDDLLWWCNLVLHLLCIGLYLVSLISVFVLGEINSFSKSESSLLQGSLVVSGTGSNISSTKLSGWIVDSSSPASALILWRNGFILLHFCLLFSAIFLVEAISFTHPCFLVFIHELVRVICSGDWSYQSAFVCLLDVMSFLFFLE